MIFRSVPTSAWLLIAASVVFKGSDVAGQDGALMQNSREPRSEVFGFASDLIFPPLPPQPEEIQGVEALPDLEEELWSHGGSYLYQPEGDRLGWPNASGIGPTEYETLHAPKHHHHDDFHSHYQMLRLPESWEAPQPLTLFSDYLGADPTASSPWLKWPGKGGYHWEPRFVASGAYQIFALAEHANHDDQYGLGHQLLLDLDLRLTGTERFHVQFRPLGEGGSGGSFWQFSQPDGYIDNSTIEPDRYWFEGELASIFGAWIDPFAVRDIHFAIGKHPFALHNNLLMNDDILGVVIGKNTFYGERVNNLNVQAFYAFQDIDTNAQANANLVGLHLSADIDHDFYEASYAYLTHASMSNRDAHYLALSRTTHYGTTSLAARGMVKIGDRAGTGDGALFVLESNRSTAYKNPCAGIEHSVVYVNGFIATEGWNSISGGNYNRLRSAYEVNPLVSIASNQPHGDIWGAAMGIQLFRHHDDESIVPELAFESRDGEAVWGLGMRYLRKTSARSYFEVLGVLNFSDDPVYRREGIFLAETFLF